MFGNDFEVYVLVECRMYVCIGQCQLDEAKWWCPIEGDRFKPVVVFIAHSHAHLTHTHSHFKGLINFFSPTLSLLFFLLPLFTIFILFFAYYSCQRFIYNQYTSAFGIYYQFEICW